MRNRNRRVVQLIQKLAVTAERDAVADTDTDTDNDNVYGRALLAFWSFTS